MPDRPRPRPLRLGHRGDARRAPENTLAAFLAALALPGCDGVEFDVRIAADGTPVVLHDATLTRVQGRHGRADALTGQDLEAAGVPSLETVLRALPRTVFLDVELKVPPNAAVVEVLERWRGPGLDRVVVSSFDPGAIRPVRAARPAWACWLNADRLDAGTIDAARALGCTGVSVEWPALDARSLAAAAAAGLEVAAWTVRDVATYDRMATLGVVAICAEDEALDAT